MIRKIFLLFALVGFSCTSDDVIRAEKTSFYNIYKNIIVSERSGNSKVVKNQKKVYNRDWLSQFSQPIILMSSLDEKTSASLVALGNYKNRLTWVSSDGISVSFENGILIATRGYSQDLVESRHDYIDSLFTSPIRNPTKTYRYLSGENKYKEFKFSCSIQIKQNVTSSFLELNIETTKFIEDCWSGSNQHTNEYYVLPNTDIVLKSKQWISETNGYIIIYNYYAFQNNL